MTTCFTNTLPAPHLDEVEGLPWVFIPGFWCHLQIFDHWSERAEKMGIRTHTVELKGQDLGSKPSEVAGVTTDDYLRDVIRAITQIGDCVLIGFSYGAVLAALAANKSGSVRHVVMINSSPHKRMLLKLGAMCRSLKYRKLIRTGNPVLLNSHDARALLFNELEPGLQRECIDNLVHASGTAIGEILSGKIEIKPVPCSAIIIGSGRDALVPRRIQKKVAKIHAAPYHEFPVACHMAMLQPGIQDEMFDFIAEELGHGD